MLLKPLVPHLQDIQALRTQITSPSTDYQKLQTAASQTRRHLGIGEQAVLDYEHLIGEFRNSGAILVPVMLGAKGNHENAMHIRLPVEDVTFIFLNLDTRLEDFKFWMSHELAHIYTPELSGSNAGEDFADAFAGALLFPQTLAEAAYTEAMHQATEDATIGVLMKWSFEHMISLNTVYQQVGKYAKAHSFPSLAIEEKSIHAARNTFHGPLISETLFDPLPPEPERYTAACEHVFHSDFFNALKRMLHESGTGPGYIQQILDISLQDATAIHGVLSH